VTPSSHAQIEQTYRRMAHEARYRPAAPSDGFGNLTVPVEWLNLDQEAERYAQWWWKEENSDQYLIGCPDFRDRPALIFLVEAARNLCGGNVPLAQRLLDMARADLTARHGRRKGSSR
jgi:hypothetical protein